MEEVTDLKLLEVLYKLNKKIPFSIKETDNRFHFYFRTEDNFIIGNSYSKNEVIKIVSKYKL